MGETPPWRCSAEAVLPRFSAEAWREGLFSPPVFKVISVEQNLKKKKYKNHIEQNGGRVNGRGIAGECLEVRGLKGAQ